MTPFLASSAFAKRGYHSAFGYGGGWHPWRRAPSRLLWFVLGATSAALYIKHKDSDLRKSYGRCKRIGPEHMVMMDANGAAQGAPPAAAPSVRPHWGPQYPLPQPAAPGWNAERVSGEAPSQPPLQALKSAFDGWEKTQDRRIEEEKEHMAKVSRQAVDAMVELTEATLASVLSTAEALKVKLAEHKAQREKEQKAIEARLEEERRNPPRLV